MGPVLATAMGGADVAALVLTVILLFTSLMVVTRSHPIHAVINLMAFFIALSGLYALLASPFLATMQVLIYVGAILVLFLFVIMLLDLKSMPIGVGRRLKRPYLILLAVVLMALLVVPLFRGGQRQLDPTYENGSWPSLETHTGNFGETDWMGMAIMEEHALALEMVSLILLVGCVGAVALIKPAAKE